MLSLADRPVLVVEGVPLGAPLAVPFGTAEGIVDCWRGSNGFTSVFVSSMDMKLARSGDEWREWLTRELKGRKGK